jgi:DeoR family fructose operon transcriptional repressor
MSGTGRSRPPFSQQRQHLILQQLAADRRADVTDLPRRLGVSGEPARKDLVQIETQGLPRRVHGGAVPVQELSFEPAVAVRTTTEEISSARCPRVHPAGRFDSARGRRHLTAELAKIQPADRELTVLDTA